MNKLQLRTLVLGLALVCGASMQAVTDTRGFWGRNAPAFMGGKAAPKACYTKVLEFIKAHPNYFIGAGALVAVGATVAAVVYVADAYTPEEEVEVTPEEIRSW